MNNNQNVNPERFTITKGELAYNDWCFEIKARKRMRVQPYNVSAITSQLDPWHNKALAGTPAEGLGKSGAQQQVWLAHDWCGNPIGELEGPPFRLGGLYDVCGLGLEAHVLLSSVTAEMNIDGIWDWVLVFTWPERR